jgi:hypothetical protein
VIEKGRRRQPTTGEIKQIIKVEITEAAGRGDSVGRSLCLVLSLSVVVNLVEEVYGLMIETILQQIDAEIANLTKARAALSVLTSAPATAKATTIGKRVISASARRKMAAAQKKRWAAFHAAKGQAPTAKLSVIQPKRMSPAARRKIAAAQRARWAKARAGTKKAA